MKIYAKLLTDRQTKTNIFPSIQANHLRDIRSITKATYHSHKALITEPIFSQSYKNRTLQGLELILELLTLYTYIIHWRTQGGSGSNPQSVHFQSKKYSPILSVTHRMFSRIWWMGRGVDLGAGIRPGYCRYSYFTKVHCKSNIQHPLWTTGVYQERKPGIFTKVGGINCTGGMEYCLVIQVYVYLSAVIVCGE